MYQEFIALQHNNSQREKPRLSISEVAFQTEKHKINKQTFKPQLKRKFSEINLKDVLLAGLNSQNSNINLKINLHLDPEQQNSNKHLKRSRSNSKPLHEQINQNFIVKHLENQLNNIKKRQVNKSCQKIAPDSFLPSIFKNNTIQSKSNQVKYQKDDQNKRTDDQKKHFSLELQVTNSNTTQFASVAFKKLRSESLIYLQNKLKLQRTKLTDRNQEKQLQISEQKQFDLPRGNTQKIRPIFPKQISPQRKEKKFYINNLCLQAPQNLPEGLQKRNYILKILQKHEKQLLPKQQNRKNSYFRVLDKQKKNDKPNPNPRNFYSSENLISRKIVFAHPDEMLLKKVQIVGEKPVKDKTTVKYESQTTKKPKQTKVKKDCINGWDFQNQQQLLQIDQDKFEAVL